LPRSILVSRRGRRLCPDVVSLDLVCRTRLVNLPARFIRARRQHALALPSEILAGAL